jgi:hypothetical protein
MLRTRKHKHSGNRRQLWAHTTKQSGPMQRRARRAELRGLQTPARRAELPVRYPPELGSDLPVERRSFLGGELDSDSRCSIPRPTQPAPSTSHQHADSDSDRQALLRDAELTSAEPEATLGAAAAGDSSATAELRAVRRGLCGGVIDEHQGCAVPGPLDGGTLGHGQEADRQGRPGSRAARRRERAGRREGDADALASRRSDNFRPFAYEAQAANFPGVNGEPRTPTVLPTGT